jgi:sulfate adenylyltransferase
VELGVPGFAVPLRPARATDPRTPTDRLVREPQRGLGPGRRDRSARDALRGAPCTAFERERDRAHRPPGRRGLLVLLTGLSGSAVHDRRGLVERLLEDGRRSVTVLDGDAVRRLLSHGLASPGRIATSTSAGSGSWRRGRPARRTDRGRADRAVRGRPRAGPRHVQRVGGDMLLVHVATPLQ